MKRKYFVILSFLMVIVLFVLSGTNKNNVSESKTILIRDIETDVYNKLYFDEFDNYDIKENDN
nr:hypothetical protein [Acholeplasmatales bacterium]